MYPFMLRQKSKKLSILILVPYIILCITAGGFHAFDTNAYHDHVDNHHSENISSGTNKASDNTPALCNNDHSEDNCIICKWLKHTQKKIQLALNARSFMPDASGLCLNNQLAYYFLNNRRYHSRSPPFIIS